MTKYPATFDTSKLEILDPASGRTSGKMCNIFYEGSGTAAHVLWQPGPLSVVYEPSAFGTTEVASGVDLVLRPTKNVLEQLKDLDTWAIEYVAKHSERLLGKRLTQAEVGMRYTSVLKDSGQRDREPTMKCKMNLRGPKQVNLWDDDNDLRGVPENWKGRTVNTQLRLNTMWINAKNFGFTLDAIHLKVLDRVEAEEVTCPFQA